MTSSLLNHKIRVLVNLFLEKRVWYIFLFLLVWFQSKVPPAGQGGESKPSKTGVIQKTQRLRMPFIANEGQTDEKVVFYARTFGGTVFITKMGEIVYSFSKVKEKVEVKAAVENADYGGEPLVRPFREQPLGSASAKISKNVSHLPSRENIRTRSLALKEELLGGKISEVRGEEAAVTKVNYFKGNETSNWKTNISTYNFVNLGEVYKGIELKLRAYGNNIEKLFYVKPDANPEMIKIKLMGSKTLRVNEEGLLEAETDLGTVKFTKPVAYQEINGKRVEVEVKYNIQKSEDRMQDQVKMQNAGCTMNDKEPVSIVNHESGIVYHNDKSKIQNQKLNTDTNNGQCFIYGFKLANYDKTRELVIDPLLASTLLGGSNADCVNSIAIDHDGNIYVAGWTSSSNFPTITGAYDTSYNNYYDAFVSKLNGDLTRLLASTFLGGSSDDRGYSIAIDSRENIYVVGNTRSSDFPITANAYDTSMGGYVDAFVAKLNGDLTRLLASTYLGGTYYDYGNSLAIDSKSNIYVGGYTDSSDFPTTTGAYDIAYNNYYDIFISKLNDNLTNLLASTYLGGSSDDRGYSIATDPGGNIYVTGKTSSSDFPTTARTYDTSYGGFGGDAFVAKLNGNLTRLLSSTYLGGSSEDESSSIAIDSGGNIYLTGKTSSSNFPTTVGAYDTSFGGFGGDAFVVRFSGDLTKLLSSTYLGGSFEDEGGFIAVDSEGNIYVAGGTSSSDFPIITGAYDTSYNNRYDAFISKLNEDLTRLLSSTYLGGSSDDHCYFIAIDSKGNVYVTGKTSSSDFPTTIGAYDTSYGGFGGDAFIAWFNGI